MVACRVRTAREAARSQAVHLVVDPREESLPSRQRESCPCRQPSLGTPYPPRRSGWNSLFLEWVFSILGSRCPRSIEPVAWQLSKLRFQWGRGIVANWSQLPEQECKDISRRSRGHTRLSRQVVKGSSFYASDWEGWVRNVKRSFSKPIVETQKDFENVWWFDCLVSSAVLFLDNFQDLVN